MAATTSFSRPSYKYPIYRRTSSANAGLQATENVTSGNNVSAAKAARQKMLSRLPLGVSGLNDQISIDRRELYAAFKNIRIYREYARGRQANTLTTDQQKMLEGVLGRDHEYCDNICGQILSEHADRLELKRMTAKNKANQKWLDDFWRDNKLDDLQSRSHRHAIRDGNYCLMAVWNDEKKKVVVHREPWWDGYTGVFIGYDAYGNMLYAVKEWDTPLGRRRTIYYEGAIERYLSAGVNTWMPYALPGDGIAGYEMGGAMNGEPIPIAYVDPNGDPMHIPFIHFANPGDEFENLGTSIFAGGIIGGQDRVNDIQWDITAAARMTGYQRTWSKGYKLKTINGKTVQPKTGPGVHYHAENPDADWGVLAAGDLTQLINTYDMVVESICRDTRTPHNVITGNWPSGTALYEVNRPINGATKARQKRFGPAWVELHHRAMELETAFGDGEGLDLEDPLTEVWADAEDRSPLEIAMGDQAFWQAALLATQAGMPLPLFLKVQGWGEDQLAGLAQAVEDELAKQQAQLAPVDPGQGINGNATQPPKTPTPAQSGQGTNTGTPKSSEVARTTRTKATGT